MVRSIVAVLRPWVAPNRPWDPDIARARDLPVPRTVQDRALQLIRQGRLAEAVEEIRAATGYDRRDGRSVMLALLYAVEVPTVPARKARSWRWTG